jgi:hypothetical protein
LNDGKQQLISSWYYPAAAYLSFENPNLGKEARFLLVRLLAGGMILPHGIPKLIASSARVLSNLQIPLG